MSVDGCYWSDYDQRWVTKAGRPARKFAVDFLKSQGYRIVKLEKKVDLHHYRVGEYDVAEEL